MGVVDAPTVDAEDEQPHGEPERMGWFRLVCASSGGCGVFFGFALQYALMTPFAMELGIAPKWASVVWLCGPVTGMFVQPAIGVWSDQCSSRWGRRRPYLLAGVATCLVGQVLIAYCKDIGAILAPGTAAMPIAVFVGGFWLLDGSNNAICVVARALLPDITAASQRSWAFVLQQAWCSLGLAGGYLMGSVDWSAMASIQPLVTQSCSDKDCVNVRVSFAWLACLLVTSSLVCCCAATEVQRAPSDKRPRRDASLLHVLAESLTRMDKKMATVFAVTVLSWLGWFAFQMYAVDFIGQDVFGGSPKVTDRTHEAYVQGTMAASRGLVLNAFVSWVAAAIALPWALKTARPAAVWCVSCVLFATLLIASRLVVTEFSAVCWLASVGAPYAVTQTVPYMLVGEGGAAEPSAGARMGVLNVAVCLPQLILSLVGGWLVEWSGGSFLLFAGGSVANVVGAAVLQRQLAADGEWRSSTGYSMVPMDKSADLGPADGAVKHLGVDEGRL